MRSDIPPTPSADHARPKGTQILAECRP
jgi:hypothetical protein